MEVIKRDGAEVDYDSGRIIEAVLAAFEEADGEITEYALAKAENIAEFVTEEAKKRPEDKPLTVEQIQDLVEKGLMACKRKDVAKRYITYREKRNRERNRKSKFMKTVSKKLNGTNIQNQNANVDELSFGGRKGEANNELMKMYALDYLVSPMARKNHLENRVYIHDLDSYAVGMHNCLTIPFDDLLKNGFNTRQTDVRPANSVNTAFQLVAVIFQLQSLQQFGGVSASHLDWTMVPYVRKSFYKHYVDGLKYIEGLSDVAIEHEIATPKNIEDISITDGVVYTFERAYQYAYDMTEKETRQAVEGMYHNLNTLQSRSGNQLPFTSINYGTCTEPEGRMVIKALLEGSIKGVGKFHKTSIFPCGIFQCMKGVNREPGEPNYDLFRLALQSTAKRLYPNYANVDWTGNAGYDPKDPRTYFNTMGCRTANGWDINGLGQLKDGRGNICPVTVIMPTIAMEAVEQFKLEHAMFSVPPVGRLVDIFMERLNDAIDDAKEMLLERFDFICEQPPESAKFMYENGLMAGYIEDEGTFSALKHGTLALGQIGLAETLQILIHTDHTTEEGMCLAKQIEQLFKDKCAKFKEEYQLNFGVYYTPAENLCYTAMKKFRAKYGKLPNISDREYFTNSMHVPVWKEMSPFEKIDLEAQLTGYSSAGCITYVELDAAVIDNLDALETIVSYALDKDIPYFAVNVPNDMCTNCGYTGLINEECPECGGRHIRRLRRVTGYLTGDYKTAFNEGKKQEVEQRYTHSKKLHWK